MESEHHEKSSFWKKNVKSVAGRYLISVFIYLI